MATGQMTFTDAGFLALLNQQVVFANVKMVLVDNVHTPNSDSEAAYSDISADECADVDYSPQAVVNLTWSEVSNRNFKLDHDVVSFGDPVDIAARYAYYVEQSGASLAAGDLVLGYVDLNSGGSVNIESINDAFYVDANATSGIFLQTLTP